MNEFINEVNQALREERGRNLWRKYGVYLIAAIVAVVAVVAGREGLVAWQDHRREAAADAYITALQDSGDSSALLVLAEQGGEGYPMLARFHHAARLADAGDREAAEAEYLRLAGDTTLTPEWRDAATLLSVMNAPDATPISLRQERLQSLADIANPWYSLALELLIGLALEEGDKAKATQIAQDLRNSGTLRADSAQRLRLIEAALGE